MDCALPHLRSPGTLAEQPGARRAAGLDRRDGRRVRPTRRRGAVAHGARASSGRPRARAGAAVRARSRPSSGHNSGCIRLAACACARNTRWRSNDSGRSKRSSGSPWSSCGRSGGSSTLASPGSRRPCRQTSTRRPRRRRCSGARWTSCRRVSTARFDEQQRQIEATRRTKPHRRAAATSSASLGGYVCDLEPEVAAHLLNYASEPPTASRPSGSSGFNPPISLGYGPATCSC